MRQTTIYLAIVVAVGRRQINYFVSRPSKSHLAFVADHPEILRLVPLANDWPAIGITKIGGGIEIVELAAWENVADGRPSADASHSQLLMHPKHLKYFSDISCRVLSHQRN